MSAAREVAKDPRLSHGAKVCYQLLSHAAPRRVTNRRVARSGNPSIRATAEGVRNVVVREVGRPYLARRLRVSVRTVSKYTRELRDAGYLTVIAPVLTLTVLGWRTLGVNRYILAKLDGCSRVATPRAGLAGAIASPRIGAPIGRTGRRSRASCRSRGVDRGDPGNPPHHQTTSGPAVILRPRCGGWWEMPVLVDDFVPS